MSDLVNEEIILFQLCNLDIHIETPSKKISILRCKANKVDKDKAEDII